MRWLIAVVLLSACTGQARPERPVSASRDAAEPERPVELDGPRLGLYRLDVEHLRPQLVDLLGDEIDEVDASRAWLVLDRDAPPMAVLSAESLDLEELDLTRHLTHFRLAWAERSRWPALECRAESPARIGCSVMFEGEKQVRFRLLAVDQPAAVGLPAPGIYRQVAGQTSAARLETWLADQGVAAERRRTLLARVAARPSIALIDGDVMLEIEPTLVGAEGLPVEVELKAFERKLEPRPGGFRARRAEARETFFDCEIVPEAIRCRDGDARWRYVPQR